MTALASLAFNVLFYAWTGVIQVACLPLLLLPRALTLRAGRLWVRVAFRLLAATCGLRHQIRGRERLPAGACIIASKHQSAWDTLIYALIAEDPSYVMKRELTWIPLFGWYLRKTGVIAIDRAGGASALRRMVAAARRIADAGRPIVIFPEGTRTAPGEQRPYHPGIAALYMQLGLPVVPVALNSGLFWGRRRFLKHPGLIVLEVLPPIPPGLDRKAFMAELRRRIETASDRLRAEGPPDLPSGVAPVGAGGKAPARAGEPG